MRMQCKGAGRLDWFQLKQYITGECDGMVITRSGGSAWATGVYCVVYLAEKRQEKRSAPVAIQTLVQYARHAQGEFGYRGVELGAVFGDHLVTALHGAYRGVNRRAAGVFEAFARLEQGLFAHHA